ncbi:MAG: thiamine phosphate synthase [Tannerella sp.]|jgi:thiamine-phosphate pyrophosphorylase|nr:thiamine phosphate synthase [Tannerella sp.]
MQLIVITAEKKLFREAQLLNLLCQQGLEILHLRKPGTPFSEIKTLLEEIDINYHSRIVLHDYFQLTDLFNVKGIHINKRNPHIYAKEGLTVSRSCHTLEEIAKASSYHYLFLSPVYDSISKIGYRKRFTAEQLRTAKANAVINRSVIALGGITSGKIPEIREYGFGGIAVSGTLWTAFEKENNTEQLLETYNKLQIECGKQ